jgi:hypothetical protein
MNKFFTYFAFLVLISSQAFAADSIKEMFTESSAHGEIRAYSYTYDFKDNTRDLGDNVIGGTFYYKTASLHGISFGLAFATANCCFLIKLETKDGVSH